MLAADLGCRRGERPGVWHVLAAHIIGGRVFGCAGTNHESRGQCERQFRAFIVQVVQERGYRGPPDPLMIQEFVQPYRSQIREMVEEQVRGGRGGGRHPALAGMGARREEGRAHGPGHRGRLGGHLGGGMVGGGGHPGGRMAGGGGHYGMG